ncbi:MAG: UDP-3-O-(3-hydroxymyristoyl)glucosamine N-acyltransferase [Gammaproteobacteria bacterium]|nr:UDP-3-O-(3-hydroxymyristoyl)glucosamine N-acyltransferase [Gammaproteobacteria bacterium]
MGVDVAWIADRLGGRLSESSDLQLTGIAPLETATSSDLSSVSNDSDAPYVARCSSAGAVLFPLAKAAPAGVVAIFVADPILACARATAWLPVCSTVRQPESVSAQVDSTADIGPGCVIEPGAIIRPFSRVGALTFIGAGTRLGAYCVIDSNVTISNSQLGNRIRVGAGSRLGTAPLSLVRDGAQWVTFPGFAEVTIADDVVIGANCTIARGVFKATSIGRRVHLDDQVHIGHDTELGDDTVVAGAATIAGSVRIGRGCIIGGRVGIVDGVSVADAVTVTAMSLVSKSIVRANTCHTGAWPAHPSRSWWRSVARLMRADKI